MNFKDEKQVKSLLTQEENDRNHDLGFHVATKYVEEYDKCFAVVAVVVEEVHEGEDVHIVDTFPILFDGEKRISGGKEDCRVSHDSFDLAKFIEKTLSCFINDYRKGNS